MRLSIVLPLALWAAPPQGTIVQRTTGWCSPVIANVTGNVTVTCIGVDPRALKRLNALLVKKNEQLTEKIDEADQWATRYHELENRLSDAGDKVELSRQAAEYLHQGDLEKAGEILDQILGEGEKEVSRVAENHFNRALVFELQFQPSGALPHLQKAYQYRPEDLKYGMEYGAALLLANDFGGAAKVLSLALDQARELAKKDPTVYLPRVAGILNNLAIVNNRTQRLKESEAAYEEALEVLRQLAETNPAEYQPDLARTLNNLAGLYGDTGRLTESEAAYRQALEIRQQLATSDPAQFGPSVANTLNDLASLYAQTERPKESEDAYRAALEIRRQLAKENPAAYLPHVATTLNNLAALCGATQRLEESETLYREALGIRRELAKTNPVAERPRLAQTQYNLANLYMKTGRFGEAEVNYREALDSFRDLARSNPSAYQPEVAKTLNNLATLYGATQKLKEAEAALREALDSYRQMAKTNPAAYLPGVAATLTNLAALYSDMQRLGESETAYLGALDAYRQLAKSNPRARSQLAETLYTLAVLHMNLNHPAEAQVEISESVTIRRALWKADQPANADELATSLLTFSAILFKTQAETAKPCALTREALGVAQDAALKKSAQEFLESCQ